MNELVSVIIPVYNREETVLNAIQSVVEQEYVNWEIILVDDGSESTEYQKQIDDPRILILNNNMNRGVSYSRNEGIRHAKGEYIVFLDSDNRIAGNYLQEMMQCMKNTGSQAVFSQWNYVYGDRIRSCINEYSEKFLKDILQKVPYDENHYTCNAHKFLFATVLNAVNYTHINAVMIKREYADFFHDEFRISEDTVWIYELLSKIERIGYIRKNFLDFISNSDSVYLFMDRCEVRDLRELKSIQIEKMIGAISGSIEVYRYLVKRFGRGGEFAKCIGVFKKTMKRKRYTYILLKELLYRRIHWKDMEGQPLLLKLRFLARKDPISLDKIDYSRIDIF